MKMTFLVLILFFLTSCVPVHYHHYQLDYEPIDIRQHNRDIEVVYIPEYRPRPLYYYNNWWYDEPYTYITYENFRGRISPRKIPKSVVRDVEQKMKRKQQLPKNILPKNRRTIRERIKKRFRK